MINCRDCLHYYEPRRECLISTEPIVFSPDHGCEFGQERPDCIIQRAFKMACDDLDEYSSMHEKYAPCDLGWEGCKHEYCGDDCMMIGRSECWQMYFLEQAELKEQSYIEDKETAAKNISRLAAERLRSKQ